MIEIKDGRKHLPFHGPPLPPAPAHILKDATAALLLYPCVPGVRPRIRRQGGCEAGNRNTFVRLPEMSSSCLAELLQCGILRGLGNRTRAAMQQAGDSLWNEDLAPTRADQRNWRWYHFAALWVGMIVAVPTWMLAAGLIEQGMSALQAAGTVLLGNVIILVPMLLIGHPGARFGVPFAVLVRSSFGTIGARLPALARALVACGWYGIQTWIGGEALLTLLGIFLGSDLRGAHLPFFGIGIGQLLAFLAFWSIQLLFVRKGILTIRRLETWTAPLKMVACFGLLWWAVDAAGGLGPIFSSPSAFAHGGPKAGQFWAVFLPSLTAMVGFWGTLALNIPDFTRFAKSQKDQVLGQTLGLPPMMGIIALISVMTTSATVVIYGEAIWDPVQLAGTLSGPFVLMGLIVIAVDTVSCNIAANLVCSAYDFASLNPARISYRTGALFTAFIGLFMMPWKLLESTNGYIFTWLTGYGALLGPIAGILIADYWLVRGRELDVEGLYQTDGPYHYGNGWNVKALFALVLGVAPNVPGFLKVSFPGQFGQIGALWSEIYVYAWFVGVAVALVTYALLMRLGPKERDIGAAEPQSA
ncbi:NCS1 family nucleobase:cation symporter-1 [Novosphingobium album (ex Hu et al. 2023)]|uniref:NCS1 family nucleobase:cation symporter-1 n=1 Tax=Novosphingobium album (ex Hu et al. 2023) TaxID=2930093 RepID=A0ABT0AXK1_9SPHN|nr:NCS1 family nucleobase:cation symporter-1 [Novosphingobium album (ex Hu et al. 2023)]MCJ2177348.1 NCS1 family nucleobase:cation symporter-1 [Novosphingobium album (ex Hu et al. 2023)]